MSRFVKAFIALSVLMNLALVGVIVGHVGQHFMEPPHKHRTWQEIAQQLPEDKRKHFEETMQTVEQDTGELRQQLSDARKKAATLLNADPFDKAAYIAQMQQIRQLYGQIQQRTVEALAGLAEQSTPEERQIFADMLRRPPHPPKDE